MGNLCIKQKAKGFAQDEIKSSIIHGHASIVLKNVKTGLVDRIESDNTFQTAALQNYMRSHGQFRACPYESSSFRGNPIWQNLVGGLLLFKNSITVGEQFMPAGNEMVGNGAVGVTNNGTPTELGSYNSVESSASTSGITQVYDFTTSQANGDINCVCLTSYDGGLMGYGNKSGNRRSTMISFLNRQAAGATLGARECIYNNTLYTFPASSSNGVYTITKRRVADTVGSIFDNMTQSLTFNLSDYSLPSTAANTEQIVYDCGNGVFRFNFWNNSWGYLSANPGSPIYYMEFDAKTDTLARKSFTNSYTQALRYTDVIEASVGMQFVGTKYAMCSNILFDITNSTVVATMTNIYGGPRYNDTGRAYPTPIELADDLIANQGDSSHPTYVYDLTTNTEYPTNGYGMPLKSYGMNGFNVYKSPLYLATINNLDTTIHKTAAQTMKVTYTLTEEVE